MGHSEDTLARSPNAFATASSRIVGYALPRTCNVGFVVSHNDEGPTLALGKQSQNDPLGSVMQSRGAASAKVHANCKLLLSVAVSRPLIGSALLGASTPGRPGRGSIDSIMCKSAPVVS